MMRRARWNLTIGVGLALIASAACSFSLSTANMSSLKLGKDKTITHETSSFAPTDTVYGVAEISNAPGNVKVKGQLAIEDVPGQQTGPIPSLATTVDLPGSGTATFTFSPPPDGWPKGKYKLEAVMLNENGEQKDQKTASFIVN